MENMINKRSDVTNTIYEIGHFEISDMCHQCKHQVIDTKLNIVLFLDGRRIFKLLEQHDLSHEHFDFWEDKTEYDFIEEDRVTNLNGFRIAHYSISPVIGKKDYYYRYNYNNKEGKYFHDMDLYDELNDENLPPNDIRAWVQHISQNLIK
jgi:hypothetical protein